VLLSHGLAEFDRLNSQSNSYLLSFFFVGPRQLHLAAWPFRRLKPSRCMASSMSIPCLMG